MPTPLAHYHECDSAFIPAQHQPAALLDIALSRNIAPDALLSGTRLFYTDILSGKCRLSPLQLHVMLRQLQRHIGEETGFLVGQRMLPGQYGAASLALRHCATLHEGLILLCKLSAQLSPLLTPRLWLGRQFAWLSWNDAWGAGQLQPLLAEAVATSIMTLSRSLCRQRLPWLYLFQHATPPYMEQYWVHLGQDVHFDQPVNLMRLPRAWLDQPNAEAASTICHLNFQQAQAELQASEASVGFLDLFDSVMEHRIEQNPSLEQLAQDFSCSPATLKRRLRKHGTHFQKQFDNLRTQLALKYFLSDELCSDAVASRLRFNDNGNFRRSFKRWTGLTPDTLLQRLA